MIAARAPRVPPRVPQDSLPYGGTKYRKPSGPARIVVKLP